MDKRDFMNRALEEAEKSLAKKEVPVGCLIVKNDEIVASSHNLRETTNRISAHAEILAIEEAANILGTWKLDECDLYTTLEPCTMCLGAIVQSRIKNLYVGTRGNKSKKYLLNLNVTQVTNIYYGILEKESQQLLQKFFRDLRNDNDKEKNNDRYKKNSQ